MKGHVEVGGQKLEYPLLHGKWDGALWATLADGSEQLLWQKNAPHEHPSRYHIHHDMENGNSILYHAT